MTKTINLTGAEFAVTGLDGAHAHIRNDSTDTIYAAKTAGITAGADGVASIPAGQADTLRGISGAVYLLGTGSAHIVSDDYVESPFKASTASGGSAVDDVARAAVNTHAGNAEIHVTADDKAMWNGKAELTDIPTTLPANGGNANSLSGRTASEFLRYTAGVDGDADTIVSSGIYKGTFANVPEGLPDGQGTLIVLNYLSANEEISGSFGTDTLWLRQWFVCAHGYYVYERSAAGVGVSEWKPVNDGGNASMLETHPASDFVLKSDYDALAARVAALEGGTS